MRAIFVVSLLLLAVLVPTAQAIPPRSEGDCIAANGNLHHEITVANCVHGVGVPPLGNEGCEPQC